MAGVATVIGLASAFSASANPVDVNWSLPRGGYTNLTFPIKISAAPTNQLWYYAAYQFPVKTATGVAGQAYIGVQPRENTASGSRQMNVRFSSFIAGTTTSNANCHTGADGGSGASCGIVMNYTLGTTYNLRVVRTAPSTWTGYIGQKVIGVWNAPHTTAINSSGMAWIERPVFIKPDVPPCNAQTFPYLKAVFGPIKSGSGAIAKIAKATATTRCPGTLTQSSTGSRLTVAFGYK